MRRALERHLKGGHIIPQLVVPTIQNQHVFVVFPIRLLVRFVFNVVYDEVHIFSLGIAFWEMQESPN